MPWRRPAVGRSTARVGEFVRSHVDDRCHSATGVGRVDGDPLAAILGRGGAVTPVVVANVVPSGEKAKAFFEVLARPDPDPNAPASKLSPTDDPASDEWMRFLARPNENAPVESK